MFDHGSAGLLESRLDLSHVLFNGQILGIRSAVPEHHFSHLFSDSLGRCSGIPETLHSFTSNALGSLSVAKQVACEFGYAHKVI